MSKIRKFEDLRCWQNTRQLAKIIYQLDAPLLDRDFGTRDQLRRASLSIMNNIAEGYSRFSLKETIRFLVIAQSSAAEVISMLYLLADIGYLKPEKAEMLRTQTLVIRKQILALIRSLNTRQSTS